MAQTRLKTIFRAASLVMLFFILSRLLGIVRDVVIANQFGASRQYEAYVAALTIPDFMFYVISGGALGSAFIPVFAQNLSQKDQAGAWQLASAILNWLFLILTTVAIIMAIFAPSLVAFTVGRGFDPVDQALAASLMRWLLISTVVFGISGLSMGILHAHQHFFLPALAPVIYNIAIILGAWLLSPIWGIYGLVIGVVTGAIGHLLVQLPGLKAVHPRYQAILPTDNPSVREVGRLMAPRVLGLAAIQLNFVWDKTLASALIVGSLAGLERGWRIMLLPQGIIAQAVAAASFPTFAALVAEESWQELQNIVVITLRNVLYLTIPATVGLIVLSRPLIQLFYERGQFTPTDTVLTTWALGFYSLGLVGHSLVEIVTRVFYALHNTKTPVIIAIVAMGLNMILSWILMNLFAQWGWPPHAGIALASSIAISIEMVWLLVQLNRLAPHLSIHIPTRFLSYTGLASGLMGLVLWFVVGWFATLTPWLLIPIGMALGAIIYGGFTFALGLAEPKMLVQQVTRRLR
ncbi:MAG: murein biosynthesis integral membrane protein MurJ [Chloroflexota bacterium]